MQAVRHARRGAPAHADDRPHARRARRADDLRAEAGALVRGAGARRRARPTRPRGRSSVGKLSGAVGTFAHLPPAIEADVCRTLGLEPAPVASQVIQRDRHAELLSALAITGSSLEKFALEIRGLQKTEIGEVEEPFAKGQKGSSAMPHKRNPIGCEQIVGLARLLRAQRRRRAREQRALARARHLAFVGRARHPARQLHRARPHAAAVHAHRRRAWWSIPSGCARTSSARAAWCFPGTVLLELARRGVSREQAYEWVQRNAMRVVSRAARLQGAAARRRRRDARAAAGGHRAGVRPRRAAAARRRHLRPGVRSGRRYHA